MAQPPQPPPKPAQPPKAPLPPLRNPAEGTPPALREGHLAKQHGEEVEGPRPTIGVKGEPIEDGERDPDTIAEEQRRRSAEMEAMGVEKWKDERDERTPEEKADALKVAAQHRIETHKAP